MTLVLIAYVSLAVIVTSYVFLNCQTGYVAIGGEEYIIEPIKGHPNASAERRQHPHLIYKRSALTASLTDDDQDDGHGTCGNDGAYLSALRRYFPFLLAAVTNKYRNGTIPLTFYILEFYWLLFSSTMAGHQKSLMDLAFSPYRHGDEARISPQYLIAALIPIL